MTDDDVEDDGDEAPAPELEDDDYVEIDPDAAADVAEETADDQDTEQQDDVDDQEPVDSGHGDGSFVGVRATR